MLSPGKVATPDTAARMVVPDRAPAAGLVPMASVTACVAVVTRFSSESRISTWTAGVNGAPAAVVAGGTTNARWCGAPGSTSNAGDVADVSPVALALNV